jgi:hypothetical protein
MEVVQRRRLTFHFPITQLTHDAARRVGKVPMPNAFGRPSRSEYPEEAWDRRQKSTNLHGRYIG